MRESRRLTKAEVVNRHSIRASGKPDKAMSFLRALVDESNSAPNRETDSFLTCAMCGQCNINFEVDLSRNSP